MWSLFLLAGAAWAAPSQQPTPPEADAVEAEDEVSEEFVVWGEAIVRAREAVVAHIESLGYDRRKEREGRTVFLHDRGYKGKVVLFDDGRLETRRTPPSLRRLEPLKGTRIRPYFLCLVQPTFCVDAGSAFFAVSERRWLGTETGVVSAAGAALVTLNDRFADAALAGRVAALPDRLEQLWDEGIAMDAEGPDAAPSLHTYRERRVALFTYWDTRTETAWGEIVRDAVAAFVRAIVQQSDHPFTPLEQAAFQAERRSLRAFPFD